MFGNLEFFHLDGGKRFGFMYPLVRHVADLNSREPKRQDHVFVVVENDVSSICVSNVSNGLPKVYFFCSSNYCSRGPRHRCEVVVASASTTAVVVRTAVGPIVRCIPVCCVSREYHAQLAREWLDQAVNARAANSHSFRRQVRNSHQIMKELVQQWMVRITITSLSHFVLYVVWRRR